MALHVVAYTLVSQPTLRAAVHHDMTGGTVIDCAEVRQLSALTLAQRGENKMFYRTILLFFFFCLFFFSSSSFSAEHGFQPSYTPSLRAMLTGR